MHAAIDAILKAFQQKLGDQLLGLFLYGSMGEGLHRPGISDINLGIVVTDDTPIHQVHNCFVPLWHEHQLALKRAPLLASQSAFKRHMRLNPAFARHLSRTEGLIYGRSELLDFDMKTVSPNELFAYVAREAMPVSMLLAPDQLDDETAVATRAHMHTLYRHVFQEAVPSGESDAEVYSRIQQFLNTVISKLPAARKWAAARGKAGTSPLLPGLQSIYADTGTAVLVFSQLTPAVIQQSQWPRLANRLPPGCKTMQIATVEQMCLVAMYETPIDLVFNKKQHQWGIDFLPVLQPVREQIMRQAARRPSAILVDDLPNTYLTKEEANDEVLHKIIHDFQNKLLNIRLENELLHRFKLVDKFAPPEPIPDRETPARQRVVALFNQFNWWAEFYANEMNAASADA